MPAEWLYEEGIGENRAILVEDGEILEAAVELPAGVRAGTIAEGRLALILAAGRRGIVRLHDATELLLDPLPRGLTEGQAVRVEVVREALAEQGRMKLARCRITEEPLRNGPTLRERILAAALPVTVVTGQGPDRLEQAGWSELLDQADSGSIPFAGGALRMSLTPAMTLFDVDGDLPPAELAVAGAAGAGRAIRRFDIGGSIGIDLPTIPGKADRQAAAAALDAVLPQPFERTSVNGFGFLQVVRRRVRPSLPETIRSDRAGAAAHALLRLAERTPGAGQRTIRAAPPVAGLIASRPQWLDLLSRRIGAPVLVESDPSLTLAGGHVQGRFA